MSLSPRLFIRLIVDSLERRSAVSWGISLHAPPLPPSVFVCRVQWSVYQSIHLPPVLHTLIRQLTLRRLISLSANLTSRICLTFSFVCLAPSCQSVSQSVSESQGNSKDLNAFGCCSSHISIMCALLHSSLWHEQVATPRPSTYDEWWCLHRARWCRWRWDRGDIGHSGSSTTWHFVLTVQS